MSLSPRLTVIAAILCSFLAASDSPAAVQYPVDSDGSIDVNILRKYDVTGLLTQVSELNLVGVNGANEAATLDISTNKAQWDLRSGDRADASATIRWELDQAYSVNKWITHWRNNSGFKPFEYELRMSDTGFSDMDVVVPQTSTPSATVTDTFTPRNTRFVEMQWWGVPEQTGREAVLLEEVEMFADAATQGPITADQGFAIKNAHDFTFSDESDTDGGFRDSLSKVADGNFSNFLRGNRGDGDARVVIDIGDTVPSLVGIFLGFHENQKWGNGGMVEVSEDGVNYDVLLNDPNNLGRGFVPGNEEPVRYVRLTNFGSSTGALDDISIHAVPEPTTLILAASGFVGLARYRRRRRLHAAD